MTRILFSNFCLQFINSQWRIPVYNIRYVSPQILATWSQVWGARRPWNQSDFSHPSSRTISVQIFSYFIGIVRGRTTPLEDHPSGYSRSLGSKKYRSILLYLIPVTFPSSKKKGRNISFSDKANHAITDGELWSVSYISFGRSLPQILQLCLFTDPDGENRPFQIPCIIS